MRQVLSALPPLVPIYIPKRKRPLYYAGQGIIVLGSYETACGGADGIGSARQVCELIHSLLEKEKPRIVLYEGLLASEDVLHSSKLPGLRVVYLTTPLETCLEQIVQRRKEAGNEKQLNPKNTTNRVAVIHRARIKLMQLGVPCYRCPASYAPKLILEWINDAG
jgi:hypothetical protein